MAIPKNKEELLKEIKASYLNLKKDLEDIPPESALRVELDGHAKGTKMSVANLVSYLVGWGELVLKWHRQKNSGAHVDFPETGYNWNELGKLAQKFYSDYEAYDYQTLLKKYDTVVKNILQLVEGYDNQQLYEIPWYGKWTMGRMIQFNTASPYKNARTRVRKWKKEKQIP